MSDKTAHQPRRRKPSPERIAKTRRQHMLLLSALVLLVFASSLVGEFVWSDREDLLQGAHRLNDGADLGAAFSESREAFRARTLGGAADAATGSWQPVVLLANSLLWSLWGECAFCFHLVNLILHGAIVIGLYGLGRHLLSHRRHGNRIAAWAAAIYAVHPATVSSVAWIGGLANLLVAVFSIATLLIFTRLPATTKSRPGHQLRWLLGMAATAMLAVLSGEWAYLLLLLALLIAMFESAERGRHPLGGISPRRLKGLGVIIATLLTALLIRQMALGGAHFAAEPAADGVVNNIGTALRHLWFLIEQTLLPGEPVVSDAWRITTSWGAVETAALLGALVLLTLLVVGTTWRHPSAFGGMWFLLCLIPGVGIFPATHYHDSQILYLAVWGVAFALAFTILQFWRPVGRQLVPGSEAIAYLPIIIVIATITAFSNARWWDHRGLFESEIANDPHYMQGRVELAKHALEHDDPASATHHLLETIDASRDETYTGHWSEREAYLLLGRAQWQEGFHDEAASSFASAIEVAPNDADAVYWLGVSEMSQHSYEAAEDSFRLAMTLRRPFPEAEADLGTALAGQKRYDEAIPLLETAVAHGHGNAWRHQALATAHIDAGRYQTATKQLLLSLALNESTTERARLAWLYWKLGDTEQAEEHFALADGEEAGDNEYIEWVRSQLHPEQRSEESETTPHSAGPEETDPATLDPA